MISIYHSLYPTGEKRNLRGIISYSHEIILVGGYRNASFSFNADILSAEEWFYTGVGRHIEAYSANGNIVWEGAVNEVSFNIGGRATKIGPLLGVSNRIAVGWQHPNYGIPGDTLAGSYDETAWGDNTNSQTRYGVLQELISGGTGEEPEMLELQASNLENLADPIVSESLSTVGSEEGISITVECIGYTRLLEKQIYNLAWQTGWSTVDLSLKLGAILDANLYFTGERSIFRDIQVVGISVPPEDEDNRTAWAIISDHISKSSISNRIRCGMEAGLSFALEKIEPNVVYSRKSGGARIFDEHGNRVENSEVIPGGSMLIADFSAQSAYPINSIKYDLDGDTVSLNFNEGSLRTTLSEMMLGGAY